MAGKKRENPDSSPSEPESKRRAPKSGSVANGDETRKAKAASSVVKSASPNVAKKDKGFREQTGSTNSAEAHAKQRALAKERKLSKPNASSIQRTKKLWERLRRKSHVPAEERKELVEELFGIVTGNIQDFVFKHDSVRTIQCALKYANKEQRRIIADELKGSYMTLAESRYAKFLVAKLLVSGDKAIVDAILAEFSGHVKRMINHPEASWILDDTYRQIATQRQKAMLLCEWYGPEFSIFKPSPADDEAATSDLEAILATQPQKRKPITEHLYGMINQLVQKQMTGFTMLHDAMLQYSLVAGRPTSSEQAAEFHELFKDEDNADLLRNLAFTKSGARVVSRAIAMGNAKDRKLILRPYKDLISDLSHDANGVNVLLAASEAIDDTVLTSKFIILPLLASNLPSKEARHSAILAAATHPTARMPLLQPFTVPGSAAEKFIVPTTSPTWPVLEEVRQIRGETSKKDPETRRAEIAKALATEGILLSTIENHAEELVKTAIGAQFVTVVLLSPLSGDQEAKSRAVAAVAELAEGDPAAKWHLAKSPVGGKMLRTLVAGGYHGAGSAYEGGNANGVQDTTASSQADRLRFSDVLYESIKSHILQWAVGDSSFVVVNMLEDPHFEAKDDAVKRLREGLPALQEAGEAGNKGTVLLLNSI